MGRRETARIRLACAGAVAVPALAGCSTLLRSDDASFAKADAAAPASTAAATHAACGPLQPPHYLTAPARLASAMFGGHLSASGDTLVSSALFETEDSDPRPAFETAEPGTSPFCVNASAEPANTAGSGATRVYEAVSAGFQPPVRDIRHHEGSVPAIPRDRLQGMAMFGVLPTHPSVLGESWIVIGDAAHDGFRGSIRYWPRGTVENERTIPSPQPRAGSFGRGLALDGNTLVVGAPSENDGVEEGGAAYVYDLTLERHELIARLTPERPHISGWFGSTIAISPKWLVVAAPGDGTYDHENDGLVYVFERDGGGEPANRVTISRPAEAVFFGASVALHGDWMAIGAPGTAIDGSILTGRAYLYRYRAGSGWELVQDQTITGRSTSFLGWSVAFAPGALLVTSPFEPVFHQGTEHERAGVLRVFSFGESGIEEAPCELTAPNPTACDVFGSALAVGDGFVAVGAPREDGNSPSSVADEENALLDSGAVYVYPAHWAAETGQSEP